MAGKTAAKRFTLLRQTSDFSLVSFDGKEKSPAYKTGDLSPWEKLKTTNTVYSILLILSVHGSRFTIHHF